MGNSVPVFDCRIVGIFDSLITPVFVTHESVLPMFVIPVLVTPVLVTPASVVPVFCHSHAPLWTGSEVSEAQDPISVVPVFVSIVPELILPESSTTEPVLVIPEFVTPVFVLPVSDITEPLFVSTVFVPHESMFPVPP